MKRNSLNLLLLVKGFINKELLLLIMDRNTLKKIVYNEEETLEKRELGVIREKLKDIESKVKLPHIVIISGMRRVGKSVLLKQIRESFYKDTKYNYVNFENEHLLDFKVDDFENLYEVFIELSNQDTLFFDEIQNISMWEIPVRRLYEDKIKFFITGSNASMLSQELGTRLTGRYIPIELYPFSFREFLRYFNVEVKEEDFYVRSKLIEIKKRFDDYIRYGGIPEYIKYGDEEILSGVYNDIIYRDILVRYNLDDDKSLKSLSRYLISNIGKELSYNKIKKNLGFGSLNTVKNYIGYFENSYLLFELDKFEYSLKKQYQAPKKIYAIDNGLANVVSFRFSEDRGRLLENLVFIELKRRGEEIYYHRDKKECDFIVRKGGEIVEAIQVCKAMGDIDTRKREIEGLLDACKSYGLNKGIILTEDQEETLKENGVEIKVLPVWKWLLF